MIFKPYQEFDEFVDGLRQQREEATAKAAATKDPKQQKLYRLQAQIIMNQKKARAYYDEISNRLNEPDLLDLPEAAARLGMTADNYRGLAANKRALLIILPPEFAKVPAWSITPEGQIDEMVLELAIEYTECFLTKDESPDKFLEFMRGTDIKIPLAPLQDFRKNTFSAFGLSDVFHAAQESTKLSLEIELPLCTMIHCRAQHPEFLDMVIREVHNKLLGRGCDIGPGLSDKFLEKYGYVRRDPGSSIIQKRDGPQPS